MQVPAKSTVRFGDFALDLSTAELSCNGDKTVLQEKPFQILSFLLEHPGQLVTREELVKQLWPDGTFVDFDQSLNKAVNRLREALQDSAEEPKFIETLPRRGYRFVAQVENHFVSENLSELPSSIVTRTERESRWRMALLAGALMLLATLVLLGFWLHKPKETSLPDIRETQITASSSDLPVTSGTISPDGKYLAYSDAHGIHLKLLATGETRTLSDVPSEAYFAWLPDSTRFFVSQTFRPGILAFSVMGNNPTEFRDEGMVSLVSPDGSLLSYTTNKGRLGDREIWLVQTDGTNARKFLEVDGDTSVQEPSWSPDGHRVLYWRAQLAGNKLEIRVESRELDGSLPVLVYSELAPTPESIRLKDFAWLPGGRIILSLIESGPDLIGSFRTRCNLWEMPVDAATGRPLGPMRRLTRWSVGADVVNLYATADGRKLSFFRMAETLSLFLSDVSTDGKRISAPKRFTTTEGWNNAPEWALDSQAVFFESDREGPMRLFRQPVSSEIALPVSTGPSDVSMPTLSPDGSFIVYTATAHSPLGGMPGPVQIMRSPIHGGTPQLLFSARLYDAPRCTRSPADLCVFAEPSADRKQVVFAAFDPAAGRGRELARMKADSEVEYAWDLSPNGEEIAVMKRVPRADGKILAAEGPIHLLSLAGKPPQEVHPKGGNFFHEYLDWTPDGKGWILSRLNGEDSELVRMDLEGNTTTLWHEKGIYAFRGVPSPDGRHIAILCRSAYNNVWLLENF